jgi:predicted GIY-YIG superfamily endonuclease
MKRRADNDSGPKYVAHVPVCNPVDYSKRVEYTSPVVPIQHWPLMSGVYLLEEGGLYYVGQSLDAAARIASHRLHPACCHFKDPRGVVLAAVMQYDAPSWAPENAHARLRAEARFIAAALSLGLTLTNTIGDRTKARLAAAFSDLSEERARISEALKILC